MRRLPAAVGVVLTLILLYPGFMSVDSAAHLTEARGAFFSDHHPPILAFIWRYIDMVIPGPFGMLVLQLWLLWTGLHLIANQLPGASSLARAAFMFIPIFLPPIFSILGAIWKDILMAGALVLAFGLAGQTAFFWLPALLATMTRHNAVVAVFPVVVLHLSFGRTFLRAFALASAAMCVLVLLSLSFQSSVISMRSFPIKTVALLDVVGIAVGENRLPELDRCFVRVPPLTPEAVQASYNPRAIGHLFQPHAAFRRCSDKRQIDNLVQEWLRSIERSPISYLQHRLRVFANVLGWRATPGDYLQMSTNFPPELFPSLDLPREPTRLQLALDAGLRAIEPYGIFRPWPYAMLALICAGWTLVKGQRLLLFLVTSGLLYEVGLFFCAPSADYRFSHWMILSSVTAALWMALSAMARSPASSCSPIRDSSSDSNGPLFGRHVKSLRVFSLTL